jgi:hypothetical protein
MFARDNVDRGRTRRVYQASARQKISLWVEMVVVEEQGGNKGDFHGMFVYQCAPGGSNSDSQIWTP